jgi:phosphotransferase system HPr (HPr) family protein
MSASSDTTPATRHEAQVVLPANLHARPAGQLARAASNFTSTIELDHNGKTINPTGVLGIMGLGATAGNTVTIRATGPDASDAVAALTDILANAE